MKPTIGLDNMSFVFGGLLSKKMKTTRGGNQPLSKVWDDALKILENDLRKMGLTSNVQCKSKEDYTTALHLENHIVQYF